MSNGSMEDNLLGTNVILVAGKISIVWFLYFHLFSMFISFSCIRGQRRGQDIRWTWTWSRARRQHGETRWVCTDDHTGDSDTSAVTSTSIATDKTSKTEVPTVRDMPPTIVKAMSVHWRSHWVRPAQSSNNIKGTTPSHRLSFAHTPSLCPVDSWCCADDYDAVADADYGRRRRWLWRR